MTWHFATNLLRQNIDVQIIWLGDLSLEVSAMLLFLIFSYAVKISSLKPI